MYDYLVKRFGREPVLVKGDVYELVKRLEQKYDAVPETLREAGVDPEMFRDWESARRVDPETRVKVLRALLEKYPIDVMEFMARKAFLLAKDVLEILVGDLTWKIQELDEEAEELIRRADEILSTFSIPLTHFLGEDQLYWLWEAIRSRQRGGKRGENQG